MIVFDNQLLSYQYLVLFELLFFNVYSFISITFWFIPLILYTFVTTCFLLNLSFSI